MWQWRRIGVASTIAAVVALGWHVSTSEREKREQREAEERDARAVSEFRWMSLTPGGVMSIARSNATSHRTDVVVGV
jgi:hypothetical protein